MILSFHPNIVADKNILCAGRFPNDKDRAAVSRARAIILPQGPSEMLYRMCRRHCAHVFPNYDMRFDYPGKLGQARLFQSLGASFPATFLFETVSDFRNKTQSVTPLQLPFIFKSNWGDEGYQVFLIKTMDALQEQLARAERLEKGGQRGFLLQEFVQHGGRSLRVVVMGKTLYSYWRQQTNPSKLLANLRAGAIIDHLSDPHLQTIGKQVAQDVCKNTGINLAGFDLLFPVDSEQKTPYLLEINYFFGRRGLGGSEKYYALLEKAVVAWLKGIGLKL
jgi:ribosomal protein S6--L-glutamate ligase